MQLRTVLRGNRAVIQDIAVLALVGVGLTAFALGQVSALQEPSLAAEIEEILDPGRERTGPEAREVTVGTAPEASTNTAPEAEATPPSPAPPPPPPSSRRSPPVAQQPTTSDVNISVLLAQFQNHHQELQRIEARLDAARHKDLTSLENAVVHLATEVEEQSNKLAELLLALLLALTGLKEIPALKRHMSTGDRRRQEGDS